MNNPTEVSPALLERHRPRLMVLARELLASDMQAKFGASDIVQQTLLEAWQDGPTLRATRPEQVMRWLKRLLTNNMFDASKAFRRSSKRSLDRELPMRIELLADNALRSTETHASDDELVQVLEAMKRLPAVHQKILRWHFLDGVSFQEIGERVGRSSDAARMMCSRSINRLRSELCRDD